MQSRFLRIAGSFTVVLVAYWAYAMAAVPLIEPRLERKPLAKAGDTPDGGEVPVDRRPQDDVASLFPENAWERGNPTVVETDSGRVFFGGYTILRGKDQNGKEFDGRFIAVKPFTLVMLPEGNFASEDEKVRQSIVLQALDRAVLEFDQPIEIRRFKLVKLVGGKLEGLIRIRSDQKLPGPTDDLFIETRDVQLSESRIATPHEVAFRLGEHHGSGRQLTIELLPGDKAKQAKASGPNIGGLRSFELTRDVKLHLVPNVKDLSAGLKLGSLGNGSAAKQLLAPSPIEVTCKGPLKFDIVEGVATFRDDVDVVRVNADGPSETLTGELLAIHFAAKDEPATAGQSAATANKKSMRLEPRSLEMQGEPVIVKSPANGIQARGQRLEYDLTTRRASLTDSREVTVLRGSDEIRAQELHYEPGAPGRLGRFLAVGPGWLRGTSPDSQQPVEANWTSELRISIDPEFPQNDVISLIGAATVRVPGMGGINADKIYAWVRRLPLPGINGLPGAAGEETSPKGRLVPDRLLALGDVQIDAPQLVGETGQLEVWFEHLPALPGAVLAAVRPAPGGPQAMQISSARQNASPQIGPQQALPNSDDSSWRSSTGLRSLSRQRGATAQQQPSPQQFGVRGNVLRLRLTSRGEQTEVAEVDLEGEAKLEELHTAKPEDKPLLVEGDRLHLTQPSPERATVSVTGRPGHVEAGGMGLFGETINLDRGRNELSINGPGLMTILADRDLQGRPTAKPELLEVRWQGGLLFDGQLATFDDRVTAKRQTQQLDTELLTISLTDRIDFGDKPDKVQPQVAKITCSGGMRMNGETYDAQGLVSIEQIETKDLTINQLNGDVTATGPGWMRQVHRGGGDEKIGIPGLAPPKAKPDEAAAAGPAKLSYRHVTFERQLTGNLQRRSLSFGNEVKTVYGEVDDWNDDLDPNATNGLGERGFLLLCDRLSINEMPDALGKRQLELTAEGNTSIEGSTFLAKAAKLTYAAGKELVTLEGDGRNEATITRQQRIGGKPSTTSARKMFYNNRTREVELKGVSGSDINDLPAGNRPQ